jgi:hypothetical protein
MAKHVPSAAASGPQGPQDATGKVGGHFHGRSGGGSPGPSVGDPDGDGDNDTTAAGRADDANPVTGSR